ncbi:DUF2637 domain-containing protein [Nocardia asteroides]|uniref:DUF2637 domain-containing protein n=1 Tax=Nocardia asteroides TaxID=1824 RepID=UPI0037CB4F68
MFHDIRKSAGRVGWVHVSVASTVLVNVCAFAMSLVSLTDLAGGHGVPQWQAWMLPLVLEGLVMASTAGTVNLTGHRAAYAWVLMILSTLTAATGNVVHAYLSASQVVTVESVVAMVVAAVPSFWLLLSTHLTVMLINNPKLDTAEVAGVSIAEAEPAVEITLAPAAERVVEATLQPVANSAPVAAQPVVPTDTKVLPIVARVQEAEVVDERELITA